ncbi:MAG: haloalkane dehalogenase [Pseudomonadota bacterium]
MAISAKPLPKRFIEVLGRRMAYAEMGDGPAIVFQHGNPTSSYLWRNVMPACAGLGRCIALDLIGMGDSEKLEGGAEAYTFAEHYRYFEAALEALGVERDVALVLHDWGSALGFHWAHRHAEAVRGIAYMEGIVAPVPGWEAWPENARAIFQALRSPAGEEMVLEKNVFVERILPSAILRELSEDEMAEYRRPFAEVGEGRRPTLSWPREIPIGGEPADVVALVQAYSDWLGTSDVPKLFVNAEPGSILTGELREICRGWPNQREVTVPGTHFIQEDSPEEIGAAVAEFVTGL